MKELFLLLVIILIQGEVTGGIQVGIPPTTVEEVIVPETTSVPDNLTTTGTNLIDIRESEFTFPLLVLLAIAFIIVLYFRYNKNFNYKYKS